MKILEVNRAPLHTNAALHGQLNIVKYTALKTPVLRTTSCTDQLQKPMKTFKNPSNFILSPLTQKFRSIDHNLNFIHSIKKSTNNSLPTPHSHIHNHNLNHQINKSPPKSTSHTTSSPAYLRYPGPTKPLSYYIFSISYKISITYDP